MASAGRGLAVVALAVGGAGAAGKTAWEVQGEMGLGINLGNTLDAPTEGSWAPAAQEQFFEAYKSAGFQTVRMPVRWDQHSLSTAPYTIDSAFVERVRTVVDWSLARDMYTIVNVHHDAWLDDPDNFDSMLPRYEAIWNQVAASFVDHAGQKLVFECFNEPHEMTAVQVNRVMATCVNTIRKYSEHATRIIQIGGISWYSPEWVLANPNFYTGPKDDYMMLHIHSYDPYGYTWYVPDHHIDFWGTDVDYKALETWTSNIQAWAQEHNLPINYGEFGCTHDQTPATGRLDWYQAHGDRIRALGWAAQVWDDYGGYELYDRATDTWDDETLAALKWSSPPSPPAPSPPAPSPSGLCPGNQGQCNCDWTEQWPCSQSDDGSECCCRCCCGKPNAFTRCKWSGFESNASLAV